MIDILVFVAIDILILFFTIVFFREGARFTYNRYAANRYYAISVGLFALFVTMSILILAYAFSGG